VPSKAFNYFALLDRIHIEIGREQGDILNRLLQLCEPVEDAGLKERYHSIAVGQWLC